MKSVYQIIDDLKEQTFNKTLTKLLRVNAPASLLNELICGTIFLWWPLPLDTMISQLK